MHGGTVRSTYIIHNVYWYCLTYNVCIAGTVLHIIHAGTVLHIIHAGTMLCITLKVCRLGVPYMIYGQRGESSC